MAFYTVTDLELTSIANAIRTKGGTSASLAFPSEFVSAINDISAGANDDGYIQTTLQQVSNSTASYVGSRAFWNFSSLESVRMDNVTEISMYAFMGCIQLSNVAFPKCEYIDTAAFQSTAITEVTSDNFPALTSVHISAFTSCSLLSRVILNDLVSFGGSISSNTYSQFFSHCPIEYIEMNALSVVPSYLFRYLGSLRSASFASATSIGSSAFYFASNLESITTGTLTGIGSNAFAFTSLKEFSISEYINVGTGAFNNNRYLSRAYIPFSDMVPSYLFQNCVSLSSVYFGEATILGAYCFCNTAISDFSGFPVFTSFSYYAFGGTSINKIPPNTLSMIDGFQGCNNLTTISDSDFPSANIVGTSAFANCKGLTNVSLSNVYTMNSYAFYSCTSLVNVSLPAIGTCGINAFQGCTALSQVSFPLLRGVHNNLFNGCTNLAVVYLPKASMIASSAFVNCFNLVSLYLGNSSMVMLYSSASYIFKSTPIGGYSGSAGVLGTVYVPESLVATYKGNASWKSISARIVGYSF